MIEARSGVLRREIELVARASLGAIATHRDTLRWLGRHAANDRPTYRTAA